MPKTNLQQQIFIDALPTKVWKVLTGCEYVNQYLLDGNVYCSWAEGSPISLTHQSNDNIETIHKGNVVQVIPGVLLKYKLHEENTGGFITITYELIPAEGSVELKFLCEGFIDVDEDYFLRIQQTKLLLQKIKWLAEYA
jgi:hypothetical protein